MAWRQDEPEYVVEQDDEAWRDEDESLRAIEFVPPVYQPRGGYSTNIQGTRGGTVNTPVGPAQIQFQRNLVSTEEFRMALSKVEADIKREASAIRAVDGKYEKITKRQDKKLRDAQQMSLLMTLMQPKLETLTLDGTA